MIAKIVGAIFGLLAVGVFAWKFKETPHERRYGHRRPYIMDVVYKYLDCGDLHFGFARIKCSICGHEYLLA